MTFSESVPWGADPCQGSGCGLAGVGGRLRGKGMCRTSEVWFGMGHPGIVPLVLVVGRVLDWAVQQGAHLRTAGREGGCRREEVGWFGFNL